MVLVVEETDGSGSPAASKATRASEAPALPVQRVTIHGHERAFVKVGEGPALLLLHGLGCNHRTWYPLIHRLAENHTVIAPDLLGHGQSAKPRADYSVGGYANGMRDLLTVLGIDKVTVVGHSFGGGVALQFAYQFPERTERIVLVSPGGLGAEVTPLIRAITLPGFQQGLGLVTLPGVRHLTTAALRGLKGTRLPMTRDLDEVAEIVEALRDPRARAALQHVTRAVVDLKGQIITMVDRAYLTRLMPLLVIWGVEDMVIPVSHAEGLSTIAPDAIVEIVGDAGHFPHKDHPDRVVRVMESFIRDTQPSRYHRGRWRTLLRNGPSEPVNHTQAGEWPDSAVVNLRGRAAQG